MDKEQKTKKEKPNSYCEFVASLEVDNIHTKYHDSAYGFPITDDNELFGRLILEINQAGLSWTTILNKEANFRKAYNNFNISKIAKYGEKDTMRLLADAGIIRNRLKIKATINNAQVIKRIQAEHGSFKAWLDMQKLSEVGEWTKLFKTTFTFTGGEIVNEFLISTGHLPGAHEQTCPIYKKTLKTKPEWSKRKYN